MKNSQDLTNPETNHIRLVANTIFLIFSLFLIASCSSSEIERKSTAQVVNTSEVREDTLGDKAKELIELYDNKNCREFFNAFPNNFEEFNQLYGYDDEKGAHILYEKYPEHIDHLYECSEVSDREKLKRTIEIGIDGKWDADASASIQDSGIELISKHPNETKEILDNLTDEKAASFWYFLFDGPHPTDKESVKKFDLLKDRLGSDSKQAKLLSEQFQKLEIDWKNH
jgi:hypothetical protein